jgi:DNA-binding SARP family transcriptional activator
MISVQTLGGVEIHGDAGSDDALLRGEPMRLALFIFLAANGRRFLSRSHVASLFWPASDEARGRNALRQALHRIRSVLGNDIVEARGRAEIRLNPELVECDAVLFEEAARGDEPMKALRLYPGKFMIGFDASLPAPAETWFQDNAHRLHRLAVRCASGMAEQAERKGDLSGAARLWERALFLSPYDEDALRHLMRVYAEQGSPGVALQKYQQTVERLERDLGIEASEETRALASSLSGG